jgi:hypothetical protein
VRLVADSQPVICELMFKCPLVRGEIVKHPVLGYEDPNVGEVRYVKLRFLWSMMTGKK